MTNDYIALPTRRAKRLKIKDFFAGLDTSIDESVQSPAAAAEIYNFDFSSGALTDGYGLNEFPQIEQQIKSVWLYTRIKDGNREDITMYHAADGGVYYIKNGIHALEGINLTGNVKGVNYRLYDEDVVLICSDKESMVVWNGENSAYSVAGSPYLNSMVLHYERLFAAETDGETLRFSTDLDPTNWNNSLVEGGYIKLVDDKGRIGRLISFLNYVYVFREYGISRLSAYADQSEFAVTGLFTSSGRIFPETVALCGDRVMFLASDGVYSFDGLTARRVLNNLTNLILPDFNARAAYADGKFFLACKLTGNQGVGCEKGTFVNNGLIVVEPNSGKYCVSRGVDVSALTAFPDKVLAVSNGRAAQVVKSARNFGEVLKKKWRSPLTDLNSDKQKVLKEIYIDTSADITLTVRADGEVKAFSIFGSQKPQRARINMRGQKLSFMIESKAANVRVSRPSLVVGEL